MEQLVIIGGGAAGLFCAASVSSAGIPVTVIEHQETVGKKILSTGNGKCNLTHNPVLPERYYCDDPAFIGGILRRFGTEEILKLWNSFGLFTREKNGYVYPYSERASAVRDILLNVCAENSVRFICGEKPSFVKKTDDGFLLKISGNVISTRALVIATGGMAHQGSGSDGSGYKLAKLLGHSVGTCVPALTGLVCDTSDTSRLAGVRAKAAISLRGSGGRAAKDLGELQFTDYGISGIPAMNISRHAAKMLRQGEKPVISIDFAPEFSYDELLEITRRTAERHPDRTLISFASGLINNKLAGRLIRACHIHPEKKISSLTEENLTAFARNLKDSKTVIKDVKGFDYAQVTAGGVDLSEINPDTMESKLCENLYFAGEIIDVDGVCGGYNLHFAWATAAVASQAVICRIKKKP